MLDLIKNQIPAMQVAGGRLSSVTLATPLDGAAASVLVSSWQFAGGSQPGDTTPGASASVQQPRRDIVVALPPQSPDALDAQYLALAWELGAWDVSRHEHALLPPGADPFDPAHGITACLGSPYTISGIDDDAPLFDNPDGWVQACARHGWMTWRCKPMWMAPAVRQKAWLHKDKTLQPDGSRQPREKPWTPWQPVVISSNHQTVIRLGRGNHPNRSKKR